MRERRVAVKRAQHRKRLKWFLLAAAVILAAVAALALLGSPLFADLKALLGPTAVKVSG